MTSSTPCTSSATGFRRLCFISWCSTSTECSGPVRPEGSSGPSISSAPETSWRNLCAAVSERWLQQVEVGRWQEARLRSRALGRCTSPLCWRSTLTTLGHDNYCKIVDKILQNLYALTFRLFKKFYFSIMHKFNYTILSPFGCLRFCYIF